MMKHMQVDKGAIKFVIRGADIMCPGLTSPGGQMSDAQPGEVVAITAEGKQNAVAIGITLLSTQQMYPSHSRDTNQGKAIEAIHFLGDGFWNLSVPS